MNTISENIMNKFKLISLKFLLLILLISQLGIVKTASAGSVNWIEVNPSQNGQQWWDKGSLKKKRNGNITVLSKFKPIIDGEMNQQNNKLYVMEINCKNKLFRDTSINGLPKLNSKWQTPNEDELIEEVISDSCSESI